MKTVKDIMTADVVWVSPSARVKTAVILMKGHNIGALPVLQTDESVAGLVTRHNVLGEPQDIAILDVMNKEYTAVGIETTVYDAAEIMGKSGASHLLVVEDDHIAGIVSQGDLLPELGKTFDPLTKLPWSDTFRDWAMNALKRGIEITIVLFDLDQFGLFNKQHGHVIGDTVLKSVAEVLKSGIDTNLDLACRYGGDEFGIVSMRHADDMIALANTLQERISKIKIDGIDQISGTYGIAGGRRTREREDMHYAATIDDLITRASKNCISRKPSKSDAPPAPKTQSPDLTPMVVADTSLAYGEGRAPRLKIETISYSASGMEANVAIKLMREGVEYSRQASGYALDGKSALRLVAEATAGAVSKSMVPGYGVVVDDLMVTNIDQDEEAVSVVAIFINPRWNVRHVGSAVVKRGDRYRAAAAALLAAINRKVEGAPRALPQPSDNTGQAAEV